MHKGKNYRVNPEKSAFFFSLIGVGDRPLPDRGGHHEGKQTEGKKKAHTPGRGKGGDKIERLGGVLKNVKHWRSEKHPSAIFLTFVAEVHPRMN